MRRFFKHLCFGFLVLALSITMSAEAFAQSYPAKPIRLLVPYAAGGATDIMARVVAQKLSENLGQQVLVENRAGAGGNIAADAVAKAAPDGYTLFFGSTGPLVINPFLYARLSFDPAKDFAPIGLVGDMPLFLVIPVSQPVHSIKDLIALAKAKPGKLNYASSGIGGTTHLAMELFKTTAGADILHIPYKGTAAGVADMLAGNIQVMFDVMATSGPHVKTGKLRFIGVTTAKRSAFAPDVPTIAESGFPGFEATFWTGFLAPAGTPREIINKLSTELAKVIALPELRESFASLGMEPRTANPEQFEAFIRSESVKWAKVVRDSGARAE
ncbi:MAG: tripartite tricarboxylate transporter substrate binding protein [Betaproteobacteria bacterium]|nr:MAG: tripartite tricarboxylate transporter substrate binding protein [Betaproteobacteria bacterium]